MEAEVTESMTTGFTAMARPSEDSPSGTYWKNDLGLLAGHQLENTMTLLSESCHPSKKSWEVTPRETPSHKEGHSWQPAMHTGEHKQLDSLSHHTWGSKVRPLLIQKIDPERIRTTFMQECIWSMEEDWPQERTGYGLNSLYTSSTLGGIHLWESAGSPKIWSKTPSSMILVTRKATCLMMQVPWTQCPSTVWWHICT